MRPDQTPPPAVTAIVVNWNGGDLVLRAIEALRESVGALTLEILVFDNGSSDGSADRLAARYPDVMLTRSRADVGFVRANNRLLPVARGETVLLLNPDAVAEPGAIATLYARLMAEPGLGACGPRLRLADGRLDQACRRRRKTIGTYVYRLLLLDRLFPDSRRCAGYVMGDQPPDRAVDVDALSGACLLARRSALTDIGLLLDERFHMYCEDEDWCHRLADAGWRLRYEPEAVVWHLKGGSGESGVSAWTGVRTAYHWHRSVAHFHHKHLASRHPAAVNLLVYLAIAGRGAAVLALRCVGGLWSQVGGRTRAARTLPPVESSTVASRERG